MKRHLCGLVALGLFIGGAGQAKGQPGYVYTPLDVPGAFGTFPGGINDVGQIVGFYYDAQRIEHAFLLSGGRYTTVDVPGASSTIAQGINNAGQIVGAYTAGGQTHGFLLSGGAYTSLDVPGSIYTFALGINASSQIVGAYITMGEATHGFLQSGGRYTTLQFPGEENFTVPYGINATGQVVGGFGRSAAVGPSFSSGSLAWLLSDGMYTTPFKVPPVSNSGARGINDAGQVVGYYGGLNTSGGFLQSGDSFTTLDAPGVSGVFFASGINNIGQIVGEVGGDGFLATPTPEPATLLLLGIGTLGFIGWTWRRRSRPAI